MFETTTWKKDISSSQNVSFLFRCLSNASWYKTGNLSIPVPCSKTTTTQEMRRTNQARNFQKFWSLSKGFLWTGHDIHRYPPPLFLQILLKPVIHQHKNFQVLSSELENVSQILGFFGNVFSNLKHSLRDVFSNLKHSQTPRKIQLVWRLGFFFCPGWHKCQHKPWKWCIIPSKKQRKK